ncbi:MAG: LLM class flavin-dependent oxidoreductase [Vicinamibacteria bacterium]|nr:LLM class flavin-dependent oxidoreductase [Vicinamibacteria bacterium]
MPAPPLSVLDLSPVVEGSSAADSFRNTRDLARHAERWGYKRFWLAEHHNMPGIGSSATSVLIGYVAEGTSTIRVGAGGVMLPNHSPLVIAEQFGTLESLYPGRIDLGLGRAPGTDPETTLALRRDSAAAADSFPEDVQQLLAYFRPSAAGQRVHAVPGEGLAVPVWLLGSSLFSARLAAMLGLPFAFASHFAPDSLLAALDVYRREFRPSEALERPYAIAALNVVAADSDAEAAWLFTSMQQQLIRLRRGTPGKLPPPIDPDHAPWSRDERLMIAHTLRYSVVGAPDTVARGLHSFIETTKADEIMVTGHIYDHAARLRSFEIVSRLLDIPLSSSATSTLRSR